MTSLRTLRQAKVGPRSSPYDRGIGAERDAMSRWNSWIPLLWIAGSMTFSIHLFALPPAMQATLCLLFGLCFALATVLDFRKAIQTKDWWSKTVTVWAFVFFTPLVIPHVRHPELLPWLMNNQFREAAPAPVSTLTQNWTEAAGNNERICTYLPTGKSYLVGAGIQKIHDPCGLDMDGWGAKGVMRVSRGEGYEFATVRGLLHSGTYAALGKVRESHSKLDLWLLLQLHAWRSVWQDGNRMAAACTREQCGFLTGARLDHFHPLGADRILDSSLPMRELAFHRPDGWYVLELGWWQSLRGPIDSESLLSLGGELFERRNGIWQGSEGITVEITKEKRMDELPAMDLPKGQYWQVVLSVPAKDVAQ